MLRIFPSVLKQLIKFELLFCRIYEELPLRTPGPLTRSSPEIAVTPRHSMR